MLGGKTRLIGKLMCEMKEKSEMTKVIGNCTYIATVDNDRY